MQQILKEFILGKTATRAGRMAGRTADRMADRIKVRSTIAALLLSLAAGAAAQTIDTNPLNRTPEARAAFDRFYVMDYDGSLARFEAIQAAHPQDPIATD